MSNTWCVVAVYVGKIQLKSNGSQAKIFLWSLKDHNRMRNQSKANIRCTAECFVKYMTMHPYTPAKGKSAGSKDVHVCAHGTELILGWWDTPCSDTDSLLLAHSVP